MAYAPYSHRLALAVSAGALTLLLGACGAAAPREKKEDKRGSAPRDPADPHAGLDAATTATVVTEPAAGEQITTQTKSETKSSCSKRKTTLAFMTSLTHDLFRRGPNEAELKMAKSPTFDAAKTVDWAIAQPEYETGVAYFVSNLLRIEQNLASDPDEDDVEVISTLNDLKQEPVVFVQRNKDRPWPEMFTTRDIYCTARTAALYNFPVDRNIQGFVPCKMQPERAGLLGLVSVLRGFKSAFYTTNSNRHRVAMALYLTKGMQLSAKTDGPTGEGRPEPLAACVPEVDNRVGTSGLIFGQAAIPKAGAICASCHSTYLAPLESAFLRFDMDGRIMNLSDVDKLNNNMLEGVSKAELKRILETGNSSCWSPDDPAAPPQNFTGLPGFGRLTAGSDGLGRALAIQIQQNLANTEPDDAISEAIVESYEAGGKTLAAAIKGYFLSDGYQCADQDTK